MSIIKPSAGLRKVFPNCVWRINTTEPVMFITIDDGPIPEVTPRTLDILDHYNAKATFFCVGHNVEKYPHLYNEILARGHQTGNHTYNHLQGHKTRLCVFLDNTDKAATLIKSNLFRPPHGIITPLQSYHLRTHRHYKIILWDVLSKDYDRRISPADCLKNVTTNAGCGSVIVFHDSVKADKNIEYALPQTLEYFAGKGFRFDTLEKYL